MGIVWSQAHESCKVAALNVNIVISTYEVEKKNKFCVTSFASFSIAIFCLSVSVAMLRLESVKKKKTERNGSYNLKNFGNVSAALSKEDSVASKEMVRTHFIRWKPILSSVSNWALFSPRGISPTSVSCKINRLSYCNGRALYDQAGRASWCHAGFPVSSPGELAKGRARQSRRR